LLSLSIVEIIGQIQQQVYLCRCRNIHIRDISILFQSIIHQAHGHIVNNCRLNQQTDGHCEAAIPVATRGARHLLILVRFMRYSV